MNPRIVLVDDESSVLSAMQRVLRKLRPQWEVQAFTCPLRAWDHLVSQGADTVVCDLQMPGMSGLDLLTRLQADPATSTIPFVVLTGSGDRELRRQALELGATDLLCKPADPDDIVARIQSTLRLRSFQVELERHNADLEAEVARRTHELGMSRMEVIWRLAKAAEMRDDDTGNHVIRVASYSRAIGVRLGLDNAFVEQIFVTAPLHDIGKIGIPDSILHKPGKLTPSEWMIMKQHCLIGYQILQDECEATILFRGLRRDGVVTDPKCDPLLTMASTIALSHHEKWDGSGYPEGLRGESIPLEARIVAFADVYDALTSARPYKRALPHEEACSIIAEGVGKHFDPNIYQAFVAAADDLVAVRASLTTEPTDKSIQEARHEACAVCG
jgi:putative two-component system response regulator